MSDICGFLTYGSECGPSVLVCWSHLLLVWVKAGGFLWLNWEGIIIKDVVDNVFFLLVFFLG
jgi:hypothetical protein